VIIFLDFDGVLHSYNKCNDDGLFSRVSFLWEILRTCADADVVFSTSWRDIYKFDEMLNFVTYGGGEDLEHRFIGTTPSIVREPMSNKTGAARREQECRLWLSGNGHQKTPWIAIDDNPVFFTNDCPALYLVDKEIGLTGADVTKLITIINCGFIEDELAEQKNKNRREFSQQIKDGTAKATDASMFQGLARNSKVLNEDEHRRQQLLSEQFYWKKPLFDAPEAKRKLKILNAIFFVMTRVGEKSSLKYAELIEATVIVGDTPIPLVIEAITKSNKSKVSEKQLRTKAALQLRIEIHGVIEEIQTVWQDADETTLEDQIRQISAGLLIAGEFQYRAQELHTYNWLIERKADHEEKKRKELERIESERLEQQIQLEQEKRRKLFEDVSGWRKSNEIRSFVAAVIAREELKNNKDLAEKLAQWSVWALAESDRLDPMKRSIDELIGYIKKSQDR
jgi:hypothetical protein